jgi:type I restriction enzyme R subunit
LQPERPYGRAIRRLNAGKVHDASPTTILADLVSLVRYLRGHGQSETLQLLSAEAAGRFNLWIGREKRAGPGYSDEQMRWMGGNPRPRGSEWGEVTLDDLQEVPSVCDEGRPDRGRRAVRARQAARAAGGRAGSVDLKTEPVGFI